MVLRHRSSRRPRRLGQAGSSVRPGKASSAAFSKAATLCCSEILGSDMECVNVSPRGFTEPRGRVVLITLQCGRGPCRVVAGQDLFDEFGRPSGRTARWRLTVR